MKRIIFIICMLAVSCTKKNSNDSDSKWTNLKAGGSEEVVNLYNAHKAQSSHCQAAGTGKKVILTGFGLFVGANFNISGAVVEAFGDKEFWPDSVESITDFKLDTDHSETLPKGTSAEGSNGVYVVNRSLSIDGQQYEVCFLVLDVLWDLSAAIILAEANAFNPELIMMTGRGGKADSATFEGGAINKVKLLAGYNTDGSISEENVPEVDKSHILPKINFKEDILEKFSNDHTQIVIDMTWNNSKMSTAMANTIEGKFKILAESTARYSNNYICNNVSFVLLHASKGNQVSLANEKLILNMTAKPTGIGFFHYPLNATLDEDSLLLWTKSIAASIHAQLGT